MIPVSLITQCISLKVEINVRMYSQILRNLNRALKAAQNEKISLHDRDFILFLIQKHIKKQHYVSK